MPSKNEFISNKRKEQLRNIESEDTRHVRSSFSMSAKDQRNLGDLEKYLDKRLLGDNEGKALYEVMTDEEILSSLVEAEENMSHKDIGHIFKARLKKDIEFLRSVGRLPEQYKDFDIANL